MKTLLFGASLFFLSGSQAVSGTPPLAIERVSHTQDQISLRFFEKKRATPPVFENEIETWAEKSPKEAERILKRAGFPAPIIEALLVSYFQYERPPVLRKALERAVENSEWASADEREAEEDLKTLRGRRFLLRHFESNLELQAYPTKLIRQLASLYTYQKVSEDTGPIAKNSIGSSWLELSLGSIYQYLRILEWFPDLGKEEAFAVAYAWNDLPGDIWMQTESIDWDQAPAQSWVKALEKKIYRAKRDKIKVRSTHWKFLDEISLADWKLEEIQIRGNSRSKQHLKKYNRQQEWSLLGFAKLARSAGETCFLPLEGAQNEDGLQVSSVELPETAVLNRPEDLDTTDSLREHMKEQMRKLQSTSSPKTQSEDVTLNWLLLDQFGEDLSLKLTPTSIQDCISSDENPQIKSWVSEDFQPTSRDGVSPEIRLVHEIGIRNSSTGENFNFTQLDVISRYRAEPSMDCPFPEETSDYFAGRHPTESGRALFYGRDWVSLLDLQTSNSHSKQITAQLVDYADWNGQLYQSSFVLIPAFRAGE